MSDLPEDVVERVARALVVSDMGIDMIDDLPNSKERYVEFARAALVASGYVQMREALEKIAGAADEENEWDEVNLFHSGREAARAALQVKP